MEPIDLGEMLRRGVRETVAADLGVDPAEIDRSMDSISQETHHHGLQDEQDRLQTLGDTPHYLSQRYA